MVRLVLFDVDGTLVHTGGAGTAAFTKTFAKQFNLHHGTEKMKFAGRTDVSLVREFFRIHGRAETPENFAQFFEHCPVLRAETEELRHSRCVLCDATARVLKQGLELLGIGVAEQM